MRKPFGVGITPAGMVPAVVCTRAASPSSRACGWLPVEAVHWPCRSCDEASTGYLTHSYMGSFRSPRKGGHPFRRWPCTQWAQMHSRAHNMLAAPARESHSTFVVLSAAATLTTIVHRPAHPPQSGSMGCGPCLQGAAEIHSSHTICFFAPMLNVERPQRSQWLRLRLAGLSCAHNTFRGQRCCGPTGGGQYTQ